MKALAVVWRDLVLLMLCGFIVTLVLLLYWVNPKALQNNQPPPGNLSIQIFWQDDRNVDIDLWVAAPGQRPVGYSNKHGEYFDLVRDDLGSFRDPTKKNFEIAYCRGITEGEYVVNTMYYRGDGDDTPVKVLVIVTVTYPGRGQDTILQKTVVLTTVGQEITVWRFSLDKKGYLVKGSVNNLFRQLRNAGHG